METSEILNSVESEKLCGEMNSIKTNSVEVKVDSTTSDVCCQKAKKRPATPSGNDMPVAKFRHVELPEVFYQLDEFCDEILCEIFHNLDSWTLLSLKCCNQRLADLIMDQRFWKNIDLAKYSLPVGLLVYVLDRVHNETHTLKLCAPPIDTQQEHHIDTLNKSFFNAVYNHGINLTVLELEQIIIDVNIMRLALLPPSLTRLVISRCDLRDLEKNIFTGIEHYLINLKEFGCEFNSWFKPSFIMALSKLPSLIKLSLRGCNQMSEFVPYGSLASRFGFRTLEYLDLRQTPLTDSDLQCFNALRKIKVLLLDAPRDDLPIPEAAATSFMSPTKKPSSANERLSQYLTAAYEKYEANITILKIEDHHTEDSNLNGRKSLPEKEENGKIDQNIEGKTVENTEEPSCSKNLRLDTETTNGVSKCEPSGSKAVVRNEEAINSSRITTINEYMELENQRTVGILLENRKEPIRVINRELRREVRPNGMPDFPEIDALQDLTPPPNNHIIVVRLGPATSAYHHFDRLMSHPIFWNMLHPGVPHPNAENGNNAANGAGGAGGGVPAAAGEHAQNPPPSRPRELACQVRYSVANRPPLDQRRVIPHDLISDRGICSFGRPQNQVDRQIVWIRLAQSPMENTLEKLILRNYKTISDLTLRHLVQCSPHLIYLDISGTSITLEGVRAFSAQKPLCNVVAHHLYGLSPPDFGILEADPFIF